MAVSSMIGASVRRVEDPKLITGKGMYVADIVLPEMVHLQFLRSDEAHAKIKRINLDKARSLSGVVTVITGKDIEGKIGAIPCAWLIPGADLKIPKWYPMATDTVRFTGDIVAAVVAVDPYVATDAVGLIEVDYEPLPVIVSAEEALEPGKPQLHVDIPNNQAFHWIHPGGNADLAFSESEVTVKQRIVNQRVQPTAMETRGAVADYNPFTKKLTMWITSQNPHIHRSILSALLDVPEQKLRVISPDIGGAFGSKIPVYPGELITGYLSMKLQKPVRWVEDRLENYLATIHGRDHVQYAEIAGSKDGKITGIKARVYANLGAYSSLLAPGIPTVMFTGISLGCYDIPNFKIEVFGAYTNTTPVDAYRGAGRPEASYLIERLVDSFAHEIGMDPADVRRINFIRSDTFPHQTASGLVYDSGDYEKALSKALDASEYAKLRNEQERLRADHKSKKLLGIGLSSYVEICGVGPSPIVGSLGLQAGLWGSATVRVHPSGKVTVITGGSPHGQGEETTFAQIVSDELGVPFDSIEVLHGDTDLSQYGMGTYGSRTTAVEGSAIVVSARKIKDKARKLAAHLLEAREDDLVWEAGNIHVKGAPGSSKNIQELAGAAYLGHKLPQGMEPGLEAVSFYDPSNFVFPFGTHVCVVEIEKDTGAVKILKYVCVDDCGNVINPMLVEGQIQGGIAQGIGQALFEQAVYDRNGQLLTGTLVDYSVPTSAEIPKIVAHRTVTPSPVNPLGVKGVGEAGTIAATQAVVNAVIDALYHLGVKNIDMPITQDKVWEVLKTFAKP